jgi:6-phosphofructokinase
MEVTDNHEIRVYGFQDGYEGVIDDRHLLLTCEAGLRMRNRGPADV